MVGRVGPDSLELTEAHRFPNRPVRVPEGLRWDILALYGGVLDGLRAAGGTAVDGSTRSASTAGPWTTGCWTRTGRCSATRCTTATRAPKASRRRCGRPCPPTSCTRRPDCSTRPSTRCTSWSRPGSPAQLARRGQAVAHSRTCCRYWLTGEQGTELTNASTTQLIDPRTRDWSYEVAARLGIDLGLFAPLRRPGDPAGVLRPEVLEETGLAGPVPVTAVGSHDTASAVAAVPRRRRTVRLHLHRHLVPGRPGAGRARADRGEPGRQLHQRAGAGRHGPLSAQHHGAVAAPGVPTGLGRPGPGRAAAARRPRCRRCGRWWTRGTPAFLAPGRMPERIAEACRASGQPVPGSPAEITRCILDSLALAHRGPSRTRSGWPATRWTSCTSSVAVPATRCCAS